MEWWEKFYSSRDYLDIFSPYIQEEQTKIQVDFILNNLPINSKHRILDLCCGIGRHTIELARRGYHVVGFDWSDEYLSIARKKAKEENLPVEFVQGDMREIEYNEEFDVVLNIFTSFGYFDEEEENERVLQQIAKILKPGGWFFFDFINLLPLICFPVPVLWHHDVESNDVIIRERYIDLFEWRLREKCSIFNGTTHNEYKISYRLYTLAEFMNMLNRCGLKFSCAFGDFDGRDVCENYPPRMIVISRK